MIARRIAVLSWLIVALGCSDEPEPVASDAPTGLELDEGRLRTRVEIGHLEASEEYVFGNVRDAIMVGTDVVVLDGQAQDVRVFDRDGTFLRRVANEGQGPGELIQANALVKVSDGRFLVVESLAGRAHLYASDGAFVRTLALGGRVDGVLVADPDGVVYLRPETPTPARLWGGDGRVQLGRINGVDAAGVEYMGIIREDEFDLAPPGTVRMNVSGEVLDTVPAPEVPDPLVYLDVPGGRAIYGFEYQPFSWWAWTRSGRLVVGRTDVAEIEEVLVPGSQRRTYARLPTRGVPVVEAERQLIRESLNALKDRPQSVLHAPSEGWLMKPVYRTILPSDEGGLWLGTYVESVEERGWSDDDAGWHEPSQEYLVVGEDGMIKGRVRGPAGVTLMFAGGGVALGRKTDPLGIQSLVVFDVVWDW